MPKTAKTLGLAGRYIQVGAYGRIANADRARDAGFADAYVK